MVGIKRRSGRRKGSLLIGGESVHVRLPPVLMKKVEMQAAKDGITVSEWIRRCIQTFVLGKDIREDIATQRQLMQAMEPFLAIVGDALAQASKNDPRLLQRMQTALERAVKDRLQEVRQDVVQTDESKAEKGDLR
jgi:hypothetical protein